MHVTLDCIMVSLLLGDLGSTSYSCDCCDSFLLNNGTCPMFKFIFKLLLISMCLVVDQNISASSVSTKKHNGKDHSVLSITSPSYN